MPEKILYSYERKNRNFSLFLAPSFSLCCMNIGKKIIAVLIVWVSFSGCVPFENPLSEPEMSSPPKMVTVDVTGELRVEESGKFSPAKYFLYNAAGEKIAQLQPQEKGFLEYDMREVVLSGEQEKNGENLENLENGKIPVIVVSDIHFTQAEKERMANEKIAIEKVETEEERLARLAKEKEEMEEEERRKKEEEEKLEAEKLEKERLEKERLEKEMTEEELQKKKEEEEKLKKEKEAKEKAAQEEKQKQRLLLAPTVLTATKKEMNRIGATWTKITLYDGFSDAEFIDEQGEKKRIVYSYTTKNKRVSLTQVASYVPGETTSWKLESGTAPTFTSSSQVFVSGVSETSSVSSTIPAGYTTWYSKAFKFQVAHPKAMYYDGSAVAGEDEDFIARVDFAYKPITDDNIEVRLEILPGAASGETELNGVYTFPRDDSTRFRIYSPNTGNDELVKIMKDLVVSTL
jgi:hypothetical protein